MLNIRSWDGHTPTGGATKSRGIYFLYVDLKGKVVLMNKKLRIGSVKI